MSLINAAKYYKGLPHQDKALEQLWDGLLNTQKEGFLEAYRADPTPAPSDDLITCEVFSKLTGYAANQFSQLEADDCNRLLRDTGFIEDRGATCMLLANILHETGNMRWMKELASGAAYEWRSDLGNTKPGDGPRYKGAGVLQLTGRYNYSRLAKALGDPRVMEGVNYVSTTYPFSSARTWIEENDLLWIAQNKGFDAVCRRINGGWNGYNDRLAKYRICQKHIL